MNDVACRAVKQTLNRLTHPEAREEEIGEMELESLAWLWYQKKLRMILSFIIV